MNQLGNHKTKYNGEIDYTSFCKNIASTVFFKHFLKFCGLSSIVST